MGHRRYCISVRSEPVRGISAIGDCHRYPTDVFYAVSNNKWSYRDTSHAREVVGYEPEDEAEQHRAATGAH